MSIRIRRSVHASTVFTLHAMLALLLAGCGTTTGDDPNLPRVLLIGDSISIGYTTRVRERLNGKANVHRIPENGRSTGYALGRLDAWLGDESWDVIHANWGLHDVKYLKDGALDLGGTRETTDADYGRNLEELVGRLAATGAVVIWASTTPIPEGAAGRVRGEEVAINRIAAGVMERRGIAIDDLHALVAPRLGDLQQPANVHFNQAGYAVLGDHVAAAIERVLGAR